MANLAPYKETQQGFLINPVKERVRGFHIVSDPEVITLGPAGGVTATQEALFRIDSYGHFDWVYIVGESTTIYTLEIFDPGRTRKLQNRPMVSANVVGTAQQPFRLPEPYFFQVGDARRELIVTFRNLFSAQPLDVRLALYGRKIYHKQAPPEVDLYMRQRIGDGERVYSYFLSPIEYDLDGTPVTVPAGGVTTFTFEGEANADSDIHKMMSVSTGSFTFAIRRESTDRMLYTGQVPGNLGTGTAQFPYYFPDTLFLERSKRLLMDVTNTSGANNTISVTMAGRVLQIER